MKHRRKKEISKREKWSVETANDPTVKSTEDISTVIKGFTNDKMTSERSVKSSKEIDSVPMNEIVD